MVDKLVLETLALIRTLVDKWVNRIWIEWIINKLI
jgi:hypothetical protein